MEPQQGINKSKPPGNADAFRRMNFLLQAAQHYAHDQPELSRFYIKSMRYMAEKALIRLDATVKEKFCKKCNTFMIPGETQQIRMNSSRETHLVWTCTFCGALRRINVAERDPESRRESNAKVSEHTYHNVADPKLHIAPSKKKKQQEGPVPEPPPSKRAIKRMYAQKKAQEAKERALLEASGVISSDKPADEPKVASSGAPTEISTSSIAQIQQNTEATNQQDSVDHRGTLS